VESNHNETYAGGSEVREWLETDMSRKPMAADPVGDGELNFFILPAAKADLCYAEIKGYKDKLIDYYVEATDAKGNVFKSPIQSVYVGTGDGQQGGNTGGVSWLPTAPNQDSVIVITSTTATAVSKLHWGVNGVGGSWTTPNAIYQPAGTTAVGSAVQTPFVQVEGKWQVVLGPFNKTVQKVTAVNFVINHGNNVWDNNNGSNYKIDIASNLTDPEPQPGGITVSFKRPTEWGTSAVNLWAWNSNGNLFASWPGQSMTDKGDGWFTHTFPESVTSVNVIFSKNGSPQSVDITGITQTTCYEYNAPSGNKFTVKTVTCPATGLAETATIRSMIYPQPARSQFIVDLPNIDMSQAVYMTITDLTGKELRREKLENAINIIQRGNLPSGILMLKITNGREVFRSEKLVLE